MAKSEVKSRTFTQLVWHVWDRLVLHLKALFWMIATVLAITGRYLLDQVTRRRIKWAIAWSVIWIITGLSTLALALLLRVHWPGGIPWECAAVVAGVIMLILYKLFRWCAD